MVAFNPFFGEFKSQGTTYQSLDSYINFIISFIWYHLYIKTKCTAYCSFGTLGSLHQALILLAFK